MINISMVVIKNWQIPEWDDNYLLVEPSADTYMPHTSRREYGTKLNKYKTQGFAVKGIYLFEYILL